MVTARRWLLIMVAVGVPTMAAAQRPSHGQPDAGLPASAQQSNVPNATLHPVKGAVQPDGRGGSGDYINARDAQWGVIGDDVHDDGPGLTAASAAANATGTSLHIPNGTYRATHVALSPGTTFGDGNTSIIDCDDTTGLTGTACITNAITGADYTLRDFAIHGRAAAVPVQGAHTVEMLNAGNVQFFRLTSNYSRFFGLMCEQCASLFADGNTVYRSIGDGIAAWDTPNAIIVHNKVEESNDDAISAHSNDSVATPVRSGVIVADNILEEGQGINALGFKASRITGNILRRSRTYGIRVEADATYLQGNTPLFAVEISGNMITDVIGRAEPNPRNTPFAYILLDGGPRHGRTGGTGVPGYPDANLSSAINELFGTGAGNYYANRTSAATVATPGGGWFDVHDNVLLRTLPASTTWAAWGYGSNIWVGNNGDGSGLYSGGEPEAMLELDGIRIDGPLGHSRIANNLIRTTGNYGVVFDAPAVKDFDYDGLVIAGNQITDFNIGGVYFAAAVTSRSNQRISITDNEIDGDPRFRSAGRGAGGTWRSATALYALDLPNLSTTGEISRNRIRNVATPLNQTGGGSLKAGNVVYGHGVVGSFSTSNTGVGTLPMASSSWTQVDEDGNPQSATFGRLLTAPAP